MRARDVGLCSRRLWCLTFCFQARSMSPKCTNCTDYDAKAIYTTHTTRIHTNTHTLTRHTHTHDTRTHTERAVRRSRRQSSLLKLVLNLRARSICDCNNEYSGTSQKKKKRRKREKKNKKSENDS